MFRRGRRSVAVAFTIAALALPAVPARAAGPEQAGAPASLGLELWEQLGRMGDWLHSMFLYTLYIDPNGGQSPNYTSFIDPNGLQSPEYTSFIDPDG
jgi:hypothetical protein